MRWKKTVKMNLNPKHCKSSRITCLHRYVHQKRHLTSVNHLRRCTSHLHTCGDTSHHMRQCGPQPPKNTWSNIGNSHCRRSNNNYKCSSSQYTCTSSRYRRKISVLYSRNKMSCQRIQLNSGSKIATHCHQLLVRLQWFWTKTTISLTSKQSLTCLRKPFRIKTDESYNSHY